ncbi:MAG TPA: ABC transporter permease [Gemmatimonadaceae bacterium]|jgi:putative ABC transport system permease protein|nr:ABC transporter permease [Gemmatimonadaceae bacterium]
MSLRHVLRRLRGSPAFTIAATLTLAIAIGATASVFSVVDGVLLKPFPYRDADRVLTIWESNPTVGLPQFPLAAQNYLDYRDQNTAFSTLAAWMGASFTVTGSQQPERVTGARVTPSYFPTLGVSPVLGRFLAPDSSGPDEVVIGYGYWQRRFGGAPSALGHTLVLDDHPYTIVGVMPPGLPGDIELWERLSLRGDQINRGSHYLGVYGRLKRGVTPEAGRRELEVIAARLAKAYPGTNQGWFALTIPLQEQLLGKVRPALVALLAAAACVLLIGAANLANLFLVRYLARERELAVRSALGATRGRLVRELVAEALTLGVGAGALGVGLAVAGVRALRALAPQTLPRLGEIGVDGRVIAFCALTSLATVLVFGMLPAWRVSRGGLAGVLKEGGRGTGSAQRHRLQNGLVVIQVAVALVLLTGAGLLVESFDHFRRMDPGFRPDGVLTAQVALPDQRYPTPERQAAFMATALEQLAAIPGVRAVSASSTVPSRTNMIGAFAVAGQPTPDQAHMPTADILCVTPDYFRTLSIPVRRGRGVLPTDDRRAPEIAVADETFAHQYLAGRDPVGQRVFFGTDTVAIVGVVASIKQRGLAEDEKPVLYAPSAQCPMRASFVSLRTDGDPRREAPALQRVFAGLDPTVPVFDVQTLSARVAQTVGTTRFSTLLASLFAVVALLLGVIGIYSVLAYIVAQRRREIGVRLALGATHAHVIGTIVRQALALTGVGIALGSATAWWVTRALSGLFLGVSPHDPAAFLGAAGLFIGVALVAASVPAFRTTRVNPAVVLT